MVLEGMFAVLVVELLLYLMFNYWGSLSSRLKKMGVTVGVFTVMLDVRRSVGFRVRRSEVVGRAVGVVGLINLVILILLFYWIVVPSVIDVIKALVVAREVIPSPFVPVVPGVTISGGSIPYFLVGIGVAVIAHELLHALTALNEGIKVVSWGLGVFLIFPFAYVRIDDEAFNKSSLSSKIRVLSAGVLSNTILALIFLTTMSSVTTVIEQYSAVVVYELDRNLGPEAPAIKADLPTPSVIYDINGTRIKSLADLRNYLKSIADKDTTLILNISRFKTLVDDVLINNLLGNELVVVHKQANISRLGILVGEALLPTTPIYLYYLSRVLYWAYVINISLAVFNAAPLVVTDGGKIVQEVFRKYGMVRLGNIIQWATVGITATLLVLGFTRFV